MIGQHRLELSLVFRLQQSVDSAGRQGGKGGIGRGEDRERARARERIDETAGLDGSNQRRVIGRTGGGADDVGARRGKRRQCGGGQAGGDNGEQGSLQRLAARMRLGRCHDVSLARRGMQCRQDSPACEAGHGGGVLQSQGDVPECGVGPQLAQLKLDWANGLCVERAWHLPPDERPKADTPRVRFGWVGGGRPRPRRRPTSAGAFTSCQHQTLRSRP